MLFEVNFTIGRDSVAKFNFFFRNLASLTSLLTAPGKNFTEVADYCQKIGVLEYPICF